MRAPQIAIEYYELDHHAKMREMFLSVRADEAIHRDVNHRFSELPSYADYNQEIVHMFEGDKRIFSLSTADEMPNQSPKV